MTESYFTILTRNGRGMFANAAILKQNVQFSTLVVGDGGGNYNELTLEKMREQTRLVHQVWSGGINHIFPHPKNGNWIVVEGIIPSDVGDFWVREVGVKDPDGNLVAVGKYPATYKPKIDQGAAKDLYIKMILEVTDRSLVTLRVDPTVVVATRKHVADELAGYPAMVRQDKDGNVVIAGHVSIGGMLSGACGNNMCITAPSDAHMDNMSVNVVGAIKIALPQSWANTMLSMDIKIYNYYKHTSCTISCGGYTYSSGKTWEQTFADIWGGQNDYPVRFGHDGDKCCIYIGDINAQWSYPKVCVENLLVGHLTPIAEWSKGWSIEIVQSLGTISSTITNSLGISTANTNISFHGPGDDINLSYVPTDAEMIRRRMLERNGASVLRADYPLLYAKIGTMYGAVDSMHFNLPDDRGQFLRIWDHGTGIDPDAAKRTDRGDGTIGDAVGTLQESQNLLHHHSFQWHTGPEGATLPNNYPILPNLYHPTNNQSVRHGMSAAGGAEARPVNRTKWGGIFY